PCPGAREGSIGDRRETPQVANGIHGTACFGRSIAVGEQRAGNPPPPQSLTLGRYFEAEQSRAPGGPDTPLALCPRRFKLPPLPAGGTATSAPARDGGWPRARAGRAPGRRSGVRAGRCP